MANENLIHKVTINGTTITNYSEYSFIHEKTYAEEPVRTNGVIQNLNGYDTYMTPHLTFSFKYMPIEVYRTIMRLYYSANEFDVVCYDTINDVSLRAKMYFEPKEMAKLLILVKGQSLENQLTTLAVLDESISLIGTNASLDLLGITFDANGGTLVGDNPNGEAMYGEFFRLPDSGVFEKSGYLLESFNTKADGTGVKYLPNYVLQVTGSLKLYAIYAENLTYTLDFNYMQVPQPSDDLDSDWIESKQCTYGQEIGALPQPSPNHYTFMGWYWYPPDSAYDFSASIISSTDIYNYKYNKTAYAWFQGDAYTITYNYNGATAGNSETSKVVRYGEKYGKLPTPIKAGATFKGWFLDSGFAKQITESSYVSITASQTIYAKFE